MTETAEDFARSTLDAFMDLKRSRVETEGGPHDLMSQLDVLTTEAQRGIAAFAVPEAVPLIPSAAARVCSGLSGTPTLIAFMSEAWSRVFEGTDPEKLPRLQRGQLEREFKAGDLDVREILIVSVVDRDLQIAAAKVAFHYADDGQVVFGEPEVRSMTEEETAYSLIARLLREAMETLR